MCTVTASGKYKDFSHSESVIQDNIGIQQAWDHEPMGHCQLS